MSDYAIEAIWFLSICNARYGFVELLSLQKLCFRWDTLFDAGFLSSLKLLILKKVKTAHKTLTSPSVTLRKLSTAGLLILTLFNYYWSSVI